MLARSMSASPARARRRASPAAPTGVRSVAAERRVDGEGPGVDAAAEAHRGEPELPQPLGGGCRADAMMAVDHRLPPGVQLVRPVGQLLHRDEPGAWERTDRVLPGVADIEDGR